MGRRIIGKDGSIVSSDEPDDWFADTDVDRRSAVGARDEAEDSYWAHAEPDAARGSGGGGGASVLAMLAAPRRRRTTILLALLAALAGAAVIFLIVRGGQSGTPSSSRTATTPSAGVTQPEPAAPAPTQPPATQLTVALPDDGVLGIGNEGALVIRLQKALAALALNPGNADGVFGSLTQSAVIAFQKAHSLEPDGLVGAETTAAINAALAAQGN